MNTPLRLVQLGIFAIALLATSSALPCWQCVSGGQYCQPGFSVGGTHCDLSCSGDGCTCMTSGLCGEVRPIDPWPPIIPTMNEVLKTADCERVVLPSRVFSDADLQVLENRLPDAFHLLDTLISKSEEGIVMGPLQGIRSRLNEARDGLEPVYRFSGVSDYRDGELLIVFDLEGHDQYSEIVISVNGRMTTDDRFDVSSGTVTALGHDENSLRQIMW